MHSSSIFKNESLFSLKKREIRADFKQRHSIHKNIYQAKF